MPLALTFLATQFRMALAAREAGLRGAGQIQAHFNKLGARIWPERARQIEQTMEAFPKERLALAVEKVFEADRGLRDAPSRRPHCDGRDDVGVDDALSRCDLADAGSRDGSCNGQPCSS